MKVVIVLGSSVGGIGAHVLDLAGFLAHRGHQVVVAAPPETGEWFDFTGAGPGIAFAPVPIFAAPHPARDLPAVRALRRLIRGADAVHAHGVRAGSLTRLALLRLPNPPRSVVTLHNAMLATGARARLLGVLERLAVRRADMVFGASGDLVDRARELGARHAGLGPIPAPPLPPPARDRAQVRADFGLDPSRPLLLAVGRLAPQKAYPVLLDALAQLTVDSKPALVIAGDGPLRADLDARIAELGVDAHLLGSRDDVADLLAAADVFVLSSDWEARALVVQEALRAGLPVIATRAGGIPDLVGEAAVLVPPGDPGALARALDALLGDPAERQRLRRAAVEQAASWPTAEAALGLVLDAYSG